MSDLPDGFTLHNGDRCPLAMTQQVDYIQRNGLSGGPIQANMLRWGWAIGPNGSHEVAYKDSDVIAYKVAE